jgi:hypothetical protein
MNMQVRGTAKVKDVPSDLYVDQYLTNFSLAYRQDADQFITPKAATPIPVMKESGIFRTFPRGYFWRDEVEVRPLGGRPVQANYKAGKDNYHAEEWALETTIDDRERSNAVDQVNLDETGVILLEGKQMIRQDRLWAQRAWGPGIWAYDYVGSADFGQFDDDTTDPVRVAKAFGRRLGKASGFKANTIILGANVEDSLAVNPFMVDRIKYTQTGIVDLQMIAALFKVANVMTAESIYNAAEEGAEDDFEFILDPNAMWIGYIEPQPRLGAPTALARFGWNGLIPGETNAQGGVITRGRDSRAYTDWIHSRQAFDIKVVAPDLGIFLTDVVTGELVVNPA